MGHISLLGQMLGFRVVSTATPAQCLYTVLIQSAKAVHCAYTVSQSLYTDLYTVSESLYTDPIQSANFILASFLIRYSAGRL